MMKNFSAKVLSQNFQYYFPTTIQNAFHAFETSWETDNLESEDKRNIYCELIDWRRDSKSNENTSIVPSNKITTDNAKVTDYGDDDDNVKHKIAINDIQEKWWTKIELKGGNFIEPLSMLTLKKVIENYKFGDIDERIFCNDRVFFGRLMKLDFLLTDVLDLENDTFWRRIVEAKMKDRIRLMTCSRNIDTNWKKLGVEMMFTEFVGILVVSDVTSPLVRPYIDAITKLCADYIENLTFYKINSKLQKLHNSDNSKLFTRNYPDQDIEHISLEFLSPLVNIKTFSITFNTEISGESYERRFFQVSVHDIKNFAKSLRNFIYLETLEITKTNLKHHRKIMYLFSSIEDLPCLRVLTLTHCNISSRKSGYFFENYLSNNTTLKVLNLKDNEFDEEFCHQFGIGIAKFRNTLDKLILSMNPILHYGLKHIINNIIEADNVIELDISSCDGFESSPYDFIFKNFCKLVAKTKYLRRLNISNNNITSTTARKHFVKAFESNYSILSISCENCGFSTQEELNIYILGLRNTYYDQNKILKKDTFTREDEIKIEEWLRRKKHPLLVSPETVCRRKIDVWEEID